MKKTKSCRYPIILVHGYGSRSSGKGIFSYWGRIPDLLRQEGNTCIVSQQDGFGTVASNAQQLAAKLLDLQAKGIKKFNLIAHSKGGLDALEMISLPGLNELVASLITLGSPHLGIPLLDQLDQLPRLVKNSTMALQNLYASFIGDNEPKAREALADMTVACCQERNKLLEPDPQIYFRSIGGLTESLGSCLDLSLSLKYFQKIQVDSDGLVPLSSTRWGPNYEIWTPANQIGVTHHDLCDFHRRDLNLIRGSQPDRIYTLTQAFLSLAEELAELGF